VAGLRFEHDIAAQSPHALLDAVRSEPQGFQLIERVFSAKAKAPPIVIYPDEKTRVAFLKRKQNMSGLSVLVNIVQRLADHL
jgi:hypothetical protein